MASAASPALSSPAPLPVKQIEVDSIRTDGGTETRPLNPDLVAEYKEQMLAGDQFPPVHVFDDGKEIWLSRGFTRTESTKQAGLSEILAVVHQGTLRDAILFSVGGNSTHGLRRTNEEKRTAATKLLLDSEWTSKADSWIALQVKVSQPFVSALRRELQSQNVLSESTKREGLDGVVRETKKIGRQIQPKTIAAEEDIRVDDAADDRAAERFHKGIRDVIHKAPRPSSLPATTPEGWSDQQITINLIVKPGKSSRRGLVVSGRAGEGKPIFRSDFTVADLDPMPAPIEAIIGDLMKSFAKKPANKPATTKKGARKK